MNTEQPAQSVLRKIDLERQKTPASNLVRYVPSGTYFARLKVKGKLIRRSLKTKTLSVAKLRLPDFERMNERKLLNQPPFFKEKMIIKDAVAAYKKQW